MRRFILYIILWLSTVSSVAQTAKDEAKLADNLKQYFAHYKPKGTKLTQQPRMLGYQLDKQAKTLTRGLELNNPMHAVPVGANGGAAGSFMTLNAENVTLEAVSHQFRDVPALREIHGGKIEIGEPAVFEIFRSVGNMAAAVADAVAEHCDFPVLRLQTEL